MGYALVAVIMLNLAFNMYFIVRDIIKFNRLLCVKYFGEKKVEQRSTDDVDKELSEGEEESSDEDNEEEKKEQPDEIFA